MTPIQQLMLGVGAKKKVYMEDVFSTYLYKGNGGANQIVNGIDNTEESMIWFKNRTQTSYPQIHDTIRGGTNYLLVSESNAAGTDNGYHINTFNNNGFTLQNGGGGTNANNKDFASWNFKSAPGFFDVVTYTGNGTSGRAISHSLGSVPGCIMVKCTSDNSHWRVYHRGNGTSSVPAEHWALSLDQNAQAADGPQYFNDTLPTSTNFTVGNSSNVNDNAKTYVAYLFAGGESTAATARSVYLDGVNDYITIDDTSNGEMATGTGDFTVEMWVKPNGYNLGAVGPGIWSGTGNNSLQIWMNGSGHLKVSLGPDTSSGVLMTYTGEKPPKGQWTHLAFVRNGNNGYLYLNGIEVASGNVNSGSYNSGTIYLGRNSGMYTGSFNAYYSNVRFTTSAVYTSSFKPPTEPLTNITNTKLLCCNNSSTTGSTVTPGTIAVGSVPVASTDSPFDDPAGHVFGENGDQNVIKCGSYIGNGNANGPEINLGWEPQWILLKNADSNNSWRIYDSMRGIVTGGDDELIHPDSTGAAYSGGTNEIDLTSTGFKVVINDSGTNTNNGQYTYMAIRRSDGYVQKPAEVATNVFTMDTGNSSSTIPAFDSGFPVDFALRINPTATWNSDPSKWRAVARLTQGKYVMTHSTDNEDTDSNVSIFDSNVGFGKGDDSSYQAWMWKRHAGFDVINYTADNSSKRSIPHGLGQTVEMMWVKNRDNDNRNWAIYHKDLNGGSNPEQYYMEFDHPSSGEASSSTHWANTAPTASHFTIGNGLYTGESPQQYIAMLFSSVEGISKVGTYQGTNEFGTQTITFGFQPRYFLVRPRNANGNWWMFDTIRGWQTPGFDKDILLDAVGPQTTANRDSGGPTSTGCTVKQYINKAEETYIYYAHA